MLFSDTFFIDVKLPPAIEKITYDITPPKYLRKRSYTSTDTELSVPEGSTLNITSTMIELFLPLL